MALLGRMRAAFADQTEEEIVRETAKALAEVRAENLYGIRVITPASAGAARGATSGSGCGP